MFLNYRGNGLWVKDLGSKISKFSSFFKTKIGQGMSILNIAGVVVMKAINICPNLYIARVNRSAKDGCRIITSTSFQGVYPVKLVYAYKPWVM